MNKYCVIIPSNLYKAPYIKYYLENLSGSIDLISWNQEKIEETIKNVNHFIFKKTIKNKKLIFKLFSYFRFKRFCTIILKKTNYDKIILAPTQVSVLLSNILFSKYKNKYVIDIRDYSYEHNKFYFNRLSRLLENSDEVVISSKGYKNFLPQVKGLNYTICHNIDEKIVHRYREYNFEKKNKETLVVSYIGNVRFYAQIEKFIQNFKNDSRFFLRIIGSGANELEEFKKKIRFII